VPTSTGSALGDLAAQLLQMQQPQSSIATPGTPQPSLSNLFPQQQGNPQQALATSMANPLGGQEPDLTQQILAARFQQPAAPSSFQPNAQPQAQNQPQSIPALMQQINQMAQPTYGDISNTAVQRFSTGNPALTTEGTVASRLTPQFAMLKELSGVQNQQSEYAKNIAQAGFLNAQSGAYPSAGGGQTAGLTGDAYLATLPPQFANQVKALAEGRLNFPTGFALKSSYWQQMLGALYQYDPNASAQSAKALGAFNTGKQGDQTRAFNVAYAHLGTLSQLTDALQNGDMKGINAISNAFQTQFGQTPPTNFNAAKQVVTNEIIKAVVGAGGGVGDRETAQQQLNAANSPEQLKGVIETYKNLIKGQLGGLKQQYEQSTGRNDYERLLSPDVKNSLNPQPAMDVKSLSDQDLLKALQ